MNGQFQRTELLLGTPVMQALNNCRVLLFGVGGVGSWCAESLIRSGVGHLTMVDSDVVVASNLNRQLMATVDTLGMPKVEAMRKRLLSINPDADIQARQEIFSAENADDFRLSDYDYVIDAIDSLQNKADLIRLATASTPTLFSSMGAALKLAPQQIRVAEFWKVKGCPLARALRNKFKRQGDYPKRKFQCVYSPELLQNQLPQGESEEQWAAKKAQVNGTVMHAVATFGLTLAGLVIQDVYSKQQS